MVFWLLPIIHSFILRKTFPCLPHLAWCSLPHISQHLFISLVGVTCFARNSGGFNLKVSQRPPQASCFRTISIAITLSSVICQCLIVLQFSTCRRCRPKLLLYWLERIMNCPHSFHLVPRCWAGLQLIGPWRVRLLGCVWFLVLSVRSRAVQSAGEIGWALVTLLCLLSHGEVERHADSGAVFPF